MAWNSETLRRGDKGDSVEELQLRLAGFRGTTWDGDFGPGTELQVQFFQKTVMEDENPDGIVGPKTFRALQEFTHAFAIDEEKIKCPCGQCDGFGNNQFRGEYREDKPEIEAFHKYEYPGIHKASLHSYRALSFFSQKKGLGKPFITSGYRCWENNKLKGRKSTNHMGKALDCDFPLQPGEDKRDDLNRCNKVRGLMVEMGNFQIGWSGKNKKSFEPKSIAPTWIHLDVRSFSSRFLQDKYFVNSLTELDGE